MLSTSCRGLPVSLAPWLAAQAAPATAALSCSSLRLLATASGTASRGGHGQPSGSGERPRDAAGDLAVGERMVVQAPLPGGLPDPAAPDPDASLLERFVEAARVRLSGCYAACSQLEPAVDVERGP